MSAQDLLVLGGCGFIGLNLAEAALHDGQEVVIADLHPPHRVAARSFDALPGRWRHVALDVTDADGVDAVLRQHGGAGIFYGATVTSGEDRERERPDSVLTVNLLGLTHALSAAARHARPRFINLSSGSAYGAAGTAEGGAIAPLDEGASPARPDTLYGVTKLASEGICRRLAALTGLDAFSVRLSTIYGPWELDSGARDTLSAPMQAAILAMRGEQAVVARRDARDWTYSRDVAQALLALMAAPRHDHDLYHISTGASCSVLDVAEALGTHFAGFSARIAAGGESTNVELHGERDRCVMSPRRLERDIGHRVPTDLSSAVADFAGWIRAHPGYWDTGRGSAR